MARVIATTTPFQGHIGPIEAIAAGLTSRGHEMLSYTGARFEERVRRTGAHFVTYPAEVDYDDRGLKASFPKRAGLSAMDRFNCDLRHIFAKPAPVHDKRFQELLADFPATAVIHDFGSLGILPMALRAPLGSRPVLVNISMSPPVVDSSDTAPYGPGLPPPTTDEERAGYDEMRHQTQAMFADGQRSVEDAFAAMDITLTTPSSTPRPGSPTTRSS
jgi:hypothetical protein